MKKRQLALLLLTTSIILLTGCVQNAHPVAVISADQLQGYPPLDIAFDAANSQGA